MHTNSSITTKQNTPNPSPKTELSNRLYLPIVIDETKQHKKKINHELFSTIHQEKKTPGNE
jgi:hypothetical protein